MADEGIAAIVEESILYGDQKDRYELYAYVMMPNHVHMLVQPRMEMAVFMKSLKGITARRANAVLGRVGLPFWQTESFDHWIRGVGEFRETAEYIENNPVRAGLVERAEEYRWSSAGKGVVRPLR